ncbi:lipocalin-like domain-containing protein [Lysobacter sp. TAF61]|uniref:lipocalin-like domain-containing protein n=1 Tax=Lysobacter sp. TAF61 TaxID=3233072 RepID=UPI003F9B6B89
MSRFIGITLAMLAGLAARDAASFEKVSPLRGTWTLVAADKVLPGGGLARDYGERPKGRLVVDDQGRYSLQIFKSERVRFATDSKADGSADEFKSAVMGSSTHYGTVTIDSEANLLVFSIEGSSFPNWEGTVQKRQYKLDGDELSYRVPPRPDGSVPISVWHRQE